mgnify:CR=1 FL=1
MSGQKWLDVYHRLPIIDDGGFYKLAVTYTDPDPNDDDRVTVSVVFEFNPNNPGRSGVYFGRRWGHLSQEPSIEIIQWGKIPLTKGGGNQYGLSGTFEGHQFSYYYGKMTAEDTPTILKATMGSYMFTESRLEDVTNINLWNMKNVINMDSMFHWARYFNGVISNWDTSNVNSMNYMFYNSASFNQPLYWDTSHIVDMFEIFHGSRMSGDISGWDTSRLTFANAVFQGAGYVNQPIDTTVRTKPNGVKHVACAMSSILAIRMMIKDETSCNKILANEDARSAKKRNQRSA